MVELVQDNWILFVIALVVGLLVAWWIFAASRRTTVEVEQRDEETPAPKGPRRNQALIDAPPAAGGTVPPPITPLGTGGAGEALAATLTTSPMPPRVGMGAARSGGAETPSAAERRRAPQAEVSQELRRAADRRASGGTEAEAAPELAVPAGDPMAEAPSRPASSGPAPTTGETTAPGGDPAEATPASQPVETTQAPPASDAPAGDAPTGDALGDRPVEVTRPPAGSALGAPDLFAPLSVPPAAAPSAPDPATTAPQPSTQPSAQPFAPAGDELLRIKGLGPKLAQQLRGLGVTSLEQIAGWDEAEIDRIDAQLGRFQGRIRRDDWPEQARLLSAGDIAAYEGRFGRL